VGFGHRPRRRRILTTTASKMRALVWTEPFTAVIRDEELPVAEKSEALLRVRAVGVCGSDLHGYSGNSPARTPPLILGHEVVGESEDGRVFVVNPLIGCGSCRLCNAGTPNLCPQRGLLGLDRPGAFAEYVKAPRANLHPLPPGMTQIVGTLVEPLATSVQALRVAEVSEGSLVAVIGCGPIGLLATYAARRAGALVTAVDVHPERSKAAARFAHAAGTRESDIDSFVLKQSDGLGADVVIDAVGVKDTWVQALQLVRPGGVVAEIGLGQAEGVAPVGALVRRGIVWRGIYAYTPEDFATALKLLAEVPPSTEWVMSASLAEGPSVLDSLVRGTGPVKAVLIP
jgi:threonine dehydrogenase-like Zn-dependent dehydrogenase